MKKAISILAIALLLLGGVAIAGCTQKTETTTEETKPTTTETKPTEAKAVEYRDTFILGYGKDHKLKGGKWGIGFFPKTHVLERLVEYDMAHDKIVPALAESWEIKDGGKTIIFHLKKGIKFSDGTEFNAYAVKFTMDRLIAKGHSLAPEGCDVIDNYTVAIHFKKPGFFNLAKMAE